MGERLLVFRMTYLVLQIIEAEMVFKVDSEGLPLEASLAFNLRHPNIVLLLDYDTHFKVLLISPRIFVSSEAYSQSLFSSLEALGCLLDKHTHDLCREFLDMHTASSFLLSAIS